MLISSPVIAQTAQIEEADVTASSAINDSIKELLLTGSYRHTLGQRQASVEAHVGYALACLIAAQQRGATALIARRDSKVQALAQWQPLPWDTHILGFAAARISAVYRGLEQAAARLQQELLRCSVEQARRSGIEYLMIRIPAGDITTIDQLEQLGFRVVDGILTFGRDLHDLAAAAGIENVRPAEGKDVPILCEIGKASFSLDRFHSDPAIDKAKADEIQRAWVENACKGAADHILVADVEDEVAGFTTLRLDRLAANQLGIKIGTVELVAVSSRFRRRGLANALCLASLHWFRDQGCSWVEVGTQLANIQATRLYESTGFRLIASSVTLRKLL